METKQGHLTKFRQIPSARISRPEAGGGGSLHLYCTGGDGKFIPPVDVPVSSLVRQITTADVDGNGSSDVVTSLPCERTLLVDILSVGVDRMQRSFEPMRKQVESWKGTRLPEESAKLVIYRAFVEGQLDVPKHLARCVHDRYFNPQIEEFAPRTTWSLSNAFTSAFKELDPIPQFKATAKLASFLEGATAGLN